MGCPGIASFYFHPIPTPKVQTGKKSNYLPVNKMPRSYSLVCTQGLVSTYWNVASVSKSPLSHKHHHLAQSECNDSVGKPFGGFISWSRWYKTWRWLVVMGCPLDNVQVEMEMIKMALDMKEAGCGEWLDNRKIAHLLLLPCSSKPTMMHFKITCAAGWQCTHYISSRKNHNAEQDAAMLYWCRRGVSVSAGSWPSLMTPQSQPCPAQTFFGHQHIFCGSLGWKFIQVSNMNEKKESSHLIILCWWIDISCTGDMRMADSIILNNIDLNLTEYCYSDFMVKPWTLWSPFWMVEAFCVHQTSFVPG